MKILFVLLMSIAFVGCSSSDKKEAEMAKTEVSESAKEAVEDVKETATSAVSTATKTASSCSVRSSRSVINFGSPKVTSRAFRRLRLKSSSDFKVTSVSSISKPFGYYNSGEFPGEATYHDYNLCDMSTSSNDCSINLEFRPRAVESYSDNITVSYTDAGGESCTLEVPLKGVSTESYLGKDSSKGLPDN